MSTAILNQTNSDRLTQHFKAEEFRCKDKTKEFLWAPELLAPIVTGKQIGRAHV